MKRSDSGAGVSRRAFLTAAMNSRKLDKGASVCMQKRKIQS